MGERFDEQAQLTEAEREAIKAAYRRHLPHGGVPGAWPRCFTHPAPVDHNPDHVVEVIAPAVERIVAERVSQALEAEADLIGNGTCCPECDAVADAMRDRALLPLNQPGKTGGDDA